MGVARGPFKAILFFVTKRQLREEVGGREEEPEAIASSGIAVFPSLRMGVTSTGSHRIGVYSYLPISTCRTLAASKIDLTLSAISGPIPSPGIKVTVYIPYSSILSL
jgi:hypothetical protein